MKRVLHKILIKLRLLNKQNGQKNVIRNDVEIIPIQKNLDLIVYWKVLHIGKGPALILQANGKEILKFDCFGKNDGHFHAAPDFGKRIFFKEETASTQIERSVSELRDKAQIYLNNQPEDTIRDIKIEQKKLIQAVELAQKKMIYFFETIPDLRDLL